MTKRRQAISLKKVSAVSIVAIAALGMVLTYTTAGVISIQQMSTTINRHVPSSGNIAAVNVGLYVDFACTQTLQSINWGDISPGGSINRVIYLKNTGSTNITLSMTKNNWNPPSANGPITLTWDKESAELAPGEVTQATLILTVAEDIIGITTFSVTILIVGSS